jgi:hypothetical protein
MKRSNIPSVLLMTILAAAALGLAAAATSDAELSTACAGSGPCVPALSDAPSWALNNRRMMSAQDEGTPETVLEPIAVLDAPPADGKATSKASTRAKARPAAATASIALSTPREGEAVAPESEVGTAAAVAQSFTKLIVARPNCNSVSVVTYKLN